MPTRNEMEQFDYALQFDRLLWPWKVHDCGLLPGIWDYRVRSLTDECAKSLLPEPYLLVTIVCLKLIAGGEPLHLVALKSVSGKRFCSFFAGVAQAVAGDLSVLCGSGAGQRLLINSNNTNHILAWDGQGEPANLDLSWRWLENVGRSDN